MCEVSAVGSSESSCFQPDIDFEEKKEETINSTETSSNSSETEERMRAEESLKLATMPNLREMNRIEEIKRELARTTLLDKQFYLYKELFSLQFQGYRDSGGSVDFFIFKAQKAYKIEKDEKEAFVNSFGEKEKELFIIYDQIRELCVLMYEESTKQLASTTHVSNVSEPYKPYLLQLLELEGSLDCHILGALLLSVEIMYSKQMMHLMLKDTISDNERKYYWEVYVNEIYELLVFEAKWYDSTSGASSALAATKLKLIFDPNAVKDFSYIEDAVDPVEQFFPFVVKYGDIEIMKGRFDEVNQKLPEWERNFQWVELHIKAADQLIPINPEKAQSYLEKAKELTKTTLWCYPFSPNRANWNEKRDEALRQLEMRGA